MINKTEIDIWKKRSEVYDKLDWVSKSEFMRMLLIECAPKADDIVLDVGIGTGAVASSLAPFVNEVIGIDISPDMIAHIGRKLDDIKCRIMDVVELDFADDSFDLVTARMVFHHISDINKASRNIFRVLKPGGKLVLAEGVPPDFRCRDRYIEIFKLKEKRHTFSESELINMLHKAGFSQIHLKPHFMKKVSINNWLGNSGLDKETCDKIKELHINADEYFKKAYNMVEKDGDLFMDWKFIVLSGTK